MYGYISELQGTPLIPKPFAMVFPTNESFPRNVLGALNIFTQTPIDYRYIVLEDWPF